MVDGFEAGGYYDEEYSRDHWNKKSENIIKRIMKYNPKYVLDIGCAFGFLVEDLRKLNVVSIGIDISEYAIKQSSDYVRPFLYVQDISSNDRIPIRQPDVIYISALQNVSYNRLSNAINNIKRTMHSKSILINSCYYDGHGPYKEDKRRTITQTEAAWDFMFCSHGFEKIMIGEYKNVASIC